MRKDAERIIQKALDAAMPGSAVEKALQGLDLSGGRLYVVSAGKAAWEMANAAYSIIGNRADAGVVITKYDHSKGPIGDFQIFEAGHPVPDENSYRATAAALQMVGSLKEEDKVLFLLSGGGSALFEQPLIDTAEMEDITSQLLACGADIVEINTIRKRLSAVKGGKFARHCMPAHVYTVVLSDIIGDPLDMIASGPAYPDSSTSRDALEIVSRYGLHLSGQAISLLNEETPKELDNVDTFVTGSVRQLCISAAESCKELGYEPVFLTASLNCEAREAGRFLGAIGRDHSKDGKAVAFLAGGETVVHLTGKGKGGRNQEIALAAAHEIKGLPNVLVFSFGSDGTDGPTDAAGGMVDGGTAGLLENAGIDIHKTLQDNDAYHALKQADALLMTGPTGTNVNDLAVVLVRP